MPGKRLKDGEKNFVIRLLNYFRRELENGGPLIPLASVQQRVSEALGISERTVGKIVRAHRATATHLSEEPPEASTSSEEKFPYSQRKMWKTEDVSNEQKAGVWNVIYDMVANRQRLTVDTLQQQLAERCVLETGRTSLWRLLQMMGLSFKKNNNRRAFMEQSSVALFRAHLLHKFGQNEISQLRRKLVFLDETWVYARGAQKRGCQDKKCKSVKGKRFVAFIAGTVDGFVPNASLSFATKSGCHAEVFLKWVKEQLVPNLDAPSLIVMDNAFCHSVVVSENPGDRPIGHSPPKRYVVDEYLRESGHEVIRLPPYCPFNALELIWAQAKTFFDKHMGEDGYGDEKVLAMWKRSLAQCTPEHWRKVVDNTFQATKIINNE